jgi:hypothetical protein
MASDSEADGSAMSLYTTLKADGGVPLNVSSAATKTVYREDPADGGSGQIDCEGCAERDDVVCGDAGHTD